MHFTLDLMDLKFGTHGFGVADYESGAQHLET